MSTPFPASQIFWKYQSLFQGSTRLGSTFFHNLSFCPLGILLRKHCAEQAKPAGSEQTNDMYGFSPHFATCSDTI